MTEWQIWPRPHLTPLQAPAHGVECRYSMTTMMWRGKDNNDDNDDNDNDNDRGTIMMTRGNNDNNNNNNKGQWQWQQHVTLSQYFSFILVNDSYNSPNTQVPLHASNIHLFLGAMLIVTHNTRPWQQAVSSSRQHKPSQVRGCLLSVHLLGLCLPFPECNIDRSPQQFALGNKLFLLQDGISPCKFRGCLSISFLLEDPGTFYVASCTFALI